MNNFNDTILAKALPKLADDLERNPLKVGATTVALMVLAAVGIQRFTGQGGKRRPPIVPSYIPWIGSYWEMDRDPDAFLKRCKEMYPEGIFGVKLHGQKQYFITDAKLINQVYRQPKLFSMNPLQLVWISNLFSLSHNAQIEKGVFMHVGPLQSRAVSQKNVGVFVEAFAAQLRKTVAATPAPTQTVPLLDFLYDIAWKSTGMAHFGPTFPVDMLADYKDFDYYVWKAAAGFPLRFMPEFVKSREKTIEAFNRYLDEEHEAWEYVAGTERIGREMDLGRRDMGVLMLTAWWALMANIPFATYWVIALQLQRPEKFRDLIDELDRVGKEWSASRPELSGDYMDNLVEFFGTNPPLPLLNSTIAEMLRFVTDSWSMRGAQEEGVTLGGYEIDQGDVLICVTREVHRGEKEYGPTAKQYIPTRFVGENGGKIKDSAQDWMPFGGGHAICQGRYFANFHMRCLITTFIKTYSFELDPNMPQKVEQSGMNRGFGIRRPKGDLYVKVTKK